MPRTPKRFEIYFAVLGRGTGAEVSKTRPVVVVSQDEMNRNLETVVVCPLSSQVHPRWRSRIQISCDGKDAEIAVDQIRTISKQRLSKRIDSLTPEAAERLRRLITEMYGG